jgi:tRNA A37 threonylcarbamoyladenosine dehydratase
MLPVVQSTDNLVWPEQRASSADKTRADRGRDRRSTRFGVVNYVPAPATDTIVSSVILRIAEVIRKVTRSGLFVRDQSSPPFLQ